MAAARGRAVFLGGWELSLGVCVGGSAVPRESGGEAVLNGVVVHSKGSMEEVCWVGACMWKSR